MFAGAGGVFGWFASTRGAREGTLHTRREHCVATIFDRPPLFPSTPLEAIPPSKELHFSQVVTWNCLKRLERLKRRRFSPNNFHRRGQGFFLRSQREQDHIATEKRQVGAARPPPRCRREDGGHGCAGEPDSGAEGGVAREGGGQRFELAGGGVLTRRAGEGTGGQPTSASLPRFRASPEGPGAALERRMGTIKAAWVQLQRRWTREDGALVARGLAGRT